jgi:hypothetical protein
MGCDRRVDGNGGTMRRLATALLVIVLAAACSDDGDSPTMDEGRTSSSIQDADTPTTVSTPDATGDDDTSGTGSGEDGGGGDDAGDGPESPGAEPGSGG